MRRSAVILTVVSFAVLPGRLTGQAAAPSADSTPEQVGQQYVKAMAAGDWRGMAKLMHPDALRRMHDMFAPLFLSHEADQWRRLLLGVASIDSARAMSDTDIFVAIIGHAMEQQADLMTMMRSAQIAFLGHVLEGSDTAHVVFRMTMTLQNVSVRKEDVISMARYGHSWRGLLRGDLTILAAALKRAASS